MNSPGKASALIVVDVQQGFDDPSWGRRNNRQCEGNIVRLIDRWRTLDWPIVFVHHDSLSPDSPLYPGNPGNALKAQVRGEHDLMVAKHTNSAFYGTPDLHQWLTTHGHDAVTICGITTNHCCETTARMAGNLGYQTTFVIDATCTFDREDLQGRIIPADEISRVTAANLHGEFATVLTTDSLLTHLSPPHAP